MTPVWILAFVCAIVGMRLTWRAWGPHPGDGLGFRRERAILNRVAGLLQELEETLGAGVLPRNEQWEALGELPRPWGPLAHASLQELRQRGGALLPTLRRLRALALEHAAALADARARSSQALAQAMACALMIPLFSGALYLLLPGVEEHPWTWLAASALAGAGAGSGALWLLRLADRARWGGLEHAERPWVLAAQCAIERFLALIRAGTPPDLAWGKSGELLAEEAPGLARLWGHSVWTAPDLAAPGAGSALLLAQAGESVRKAVQVSLMEGRPCAERVEGALDSLRKDLRAHSERELQLLGTRALKPLFAFVAPSLLGLLGFGLYLAAREAIAR